MRADGTEVVRVRPNAAGAMIRTRPNGEADVVYSDSDDLNALDVSLGERWVRQVAPGVYVTWVRQMTGFL